ncbi:MAG: ATP-binding protein [Desulfobacterales bacterium]|nr:ATP-binding protein [Desulfobacterales bacterium]MBS3754611.1 ATP-binding protein [Desulfobacterales bacterium]
MSTADKSPLRSPAGVRQRFTRLSAWREQARNEAARTETRLEEIRRYLSISEKVSEALESLNQKLFRELLDVIEDKLTIALREVLEQPISLKAEVEWKRNAASVEFWIEREGLREDILKGQGGSVANILSVGLRMFALTALDEGRHRRFLVLDEQDCWLHPELVPRLVKIVHDAGRALDFQVLMVSHHDADSFARYADRIYRLVPRGEDGVSVVPADQGPAAEDPL